MPSPAPPTLNPPPQRTPNSRSSLDRELPHDLDAERAVLGSMLLDAAAVSEAIMVLQDAGRDAFWNERHQRLYDHIVGLWQSNRSIDGVLIKDEAERSGLFESLGGYDFLAECVNAVPSHLRVREYASIIRDKFLLRQLIRAAARAMDEAFDDRAPTAEVLDNASKYIFEVTERGVTGGAEPLPDLIEEVFRRIEANDGSRLTGEETGYYQLDDMTCGFQPAELIIVAGRPSMGKTALGLNIAEHMALSNNRPVLFFSLEMSKQQVAQRLLCSRARVDAQRLRRGRHDDNDLARLQRAADEMRDRPLFVDDTSSLSVMELRARARMNKRKHDVCAVFVDYLQLMHTPGSESRQAEVASVSRGLKALAKELSVPVIAMAQLNRKPADRTGNRPMMSDLRESGAIEQDADVIALLHRESYYKRSNEGGEGGEEDNSAELIIAKQRNGPVGTVDLHFNRQWTRFDNPDSTGRYVDDRESQGGRPDVDFP
ncbi:MAG: replicative DNA helicase [Planctomycetes bacterium]|nr:replicative DNA helicase [Planctomycetota bacterium]